MTVYDGSYSLGELRAANSLIEAACIGQPRTFPSSHADQRGQPKIALDRPTQSREVWKQEARSTSSSSGQPRTTKDSLGQPKTGLDSIV